MGSSEPIPFSPRDCGSKVPERDLKGRVASRHRGSQAGQAFTCPRNDTETVMTVAASELLPVFPDAWCLLFPRAPRQAKLLSFAAAYDLGAEKRKSQY